MTVRRIAVCSRSFSRNEVLRAELLARYPHVTFNDDGRSLAGTDLISFLRGHEKAIVALERIDEGVLEAVPELRVISKYGVGLDGLDLSALRARGVQLGWTPGVNRRSVAELVIAFAIDLLHGVQRVARQVRVGAWRQLVGRQLSGRTFGVLGLGRIGSDVVTLLSPFGCTILAHDIVERDEMKQRGVRYVALDTLLSESEVLSIHLPLDESTRGMLDAARLTRLRPDAVLINTSRGGIVDEVALRDSLIAGQLAGAAFDVFAIEPPTDLELLNLENFIVTPHIGGSTIEAILAMGRAAIRGLDEPAPL